PDFHYPAQAEVRKSSRYELRSASNLTVLRASDFVLLCFLILMQGSPVIRKLLDQGLIDRLPLTFSTYCFDQIKDWDLLFKAEQDYFERLFGLLGRSEQNLVDEMFEPLRGVERKMGVNEKVWTKRQFTLDQVDFLNRSEHYPEWRRVITDIFSRLNPLLDEEVVRAGRPRLVIVTCPAELPVGPDRMWMRLKGQGKMIRLDLGTGDDEEFLARLLTGDRRSARQKTLPELYAATKAKSPHDVWMVEAGSGLSSMTVTAPAGLVKLSYDALQPYRTRLMKEVDRLLKTQDIPGPRQLGGKLKQLRVMPSENEAASDPVLAEFMRSVLLSGNGTLLINNTFVEWATVQAVRRAKPSMAVVSFGVRNKIKPFSSLLIYTEQETTTPVPTQVDTLGSYVDLEVLNHYVWMEFEKYPEYRRNTVYYFVGEGMDEMLLLAPADFPLLKANSAVPLSELFALARDWMQV
ncbi:MAG TPA: hypothetical protein VFS12_15730, partial [Terriglobia bacterium]|nr:hypothetical protein [Terriglobia bacterium]